MDIYIQPFLNKIPFYFLVMTRITSALMTDAIFGAHVVPARLRLMLALAMTAITVPLIHTEPVIQNFALNSSFLIIEQVLVGLAIGIILQLVFQVAIFGGQIIAYQTGLDIANLMIPSHSMNVGVISELYYISAILLFLILNGHLHLIEFIVESFKTLPIDPTHPLALPFDKIAGHAAQMFTGALSIALPTVISLLIVNITFAVMTRSAPQLNIFTIGFPVTLILGFVVMFLTFNSVMLDIQTFFSDGFLALKQLIKAN